MKYTELPVKYHV